jgi:hypothetical protein
MDAVKVPWGEGEQLVRQFDVTVSGPPRGGKASIQRQRYSERNLDQLGKDVKLWLENRDIVFQIVEVTIS